MKWNRLVLFGLLLIVLVIVVGIFLTFRSIPPLEDQVPGSPVSVQITAPLIGEFFSASQAVVIQVQATSPNNVSSLEVWVDGELIDSQAVSQQFPIAVTADFSLTDASPGIHVFMAQATDTSGLTGQSSIVVATIQSSPGIPEYTASEGDSLASISDFLGVSEGEITVANPGIDPASPLAEGQTVQLPVPEAKPPLVQEEKPQSSQPPTEPTAPPNPAIYKLTDLIKQWLPPKPLPMPPLLTGVIEDCKQVKLTIVPQSSNEDGYFMYRWVLGEQSFAFQNITVLGLGGAEMQPLLYTEKMPGLAAFYYVGAFNMQGEVSSAPVGLFYDETCQTGQGSKASAIELIATFVVDIPVDKSYCYFSNSSGEWRRFPTKPFDFFQPGQVNLDSVLLDIYTPNPILQMECWGWDGSTLQFLGSGEAAITPEVTKLVGTNFSFDLPVLTLLNNPPGGDTPDVGVTDFFIDLEDKKMPPPINLREAENGTICAEHLSLYPGPCQEILDKQVKQEYVFVWDWVEKTCWGSQTNCEWLKPDEGVGFNLYMEDVNNNATLISTIWDTGVIAPLPWGYQCFYVTAFADTPTGKVESTPSNQFCPDKNNPPEVLVLKPTHTLTQTKQSLYICMFPPKHPADGLTAGQVMVGVYDTNCWDQKFQGAVMFDLSALKNIAGGYSLQNAELRFKQGSSYYQMDSPGFEVATNEKPFCAVEIGYGTGGGEWTSWDPQTALNGGYPLLTGMSSSWTPFPAYGPLQYEMDVSYLVKSGFPGAFIIRTNIDQLYKQGNYQSWSTTNICWNRLQDFELEIKYYLLGQ